MHPDESDKAPPRIKYTSKVRRGMKLALALLAANVDDDQPPAATIMGRWSRAEKSDYQVALVWMRQEAAR